MWLGRPRGPSIEILISTELCPWIAFRGQVTDHHGRSVGSRTVLAGGVARTSSASRLEVDSSSSAETDGQVDHARELERARSAYVAVILCAEASLDRRPRRSAQSPSRVALEVCAGEKARNLFTNSPDLSIRRPQPHQPHPGPRPPRQPRQLRQLQPLQPRRPREPRRPCEPCRPPRHPRPRRGKRRAPRRVPPHPAPQRPRRC